LLFASCILPLSLQLPVNRKFRNCCYYYYYYYYYYYDYYYYYYY